MAEYIKREAALEICEAEYQARLRMCDYCGDTVAWNICSEIKALPAADVDPVVHGAWIDFYGDHKTAECSECQQLFEVTFDGPSKPEFFAAFQDSYRYCPNCGARMDGGSNG